MGRVLVLIDQLFDEAFPNMPSGKRGAEFPRSAGGNQETVRIYGKSRGLIHVVQLGGGLRGELQRWEEPGRR
jgi:hypothetical protein